MDRFRERLLDLSNRNPLLNYRKSRWRTLEILRKRPDQVFERLVNDGKRFRFEPLVPIEEEQLALAGVDSGDPADDAPASHAGGAAPGNAVGPFDGLADDGRGPADDRLQTALAPELMESVLKSMAREALTAIEETGVNYLFLAIGMLEWREREDSEKGHLAPLILVPVSIDRSFNGRSLKYEYSITWQGDELQYNLCLAKRMEKDFGLRLPEYDGEQFPEQYFAEVEKAIAPKTNWAVRRDHLIGFFSFQKMLMYLDLDPRTWELKGKLSLDSVAGTLIAGQDAEADSCLYAPDYEIDLQRDARMIGLITDADSSQHSALLDVQQGKNLVIEGPPGTGKSQTITNAIAAAIHSGKTVLFVAEKLAALKVVSDRLGELGLGKFCLELHSDAGPRHVFESLKERMNSGFDEPHELQSVREDLERKRKMIGDYLAATSQPAGPYGEPLYEVMWRIIELRSRRIRSARQALFAADVDRSDFDDNVQLLEAFVETLAEVQQPRTSPWWGFWATSVNPNDVEPIARALDEMHAIGDDVAVAAANLQETCGEGLVQWIAERDVVDPASFLRMANEISPLSISHDLSVFQNAQCRELGRELANAVEQARALLSESSRYLLEDRGDAEGAAPAIRQIIRQRLKSAAGGATVKNLRGLKSQPHTLPPVLTRVEAIASALKSQGFGPIRTIREYHTAEDLFRYLRHPILNAVSELPPALFLAQAPGTFKQSRAEAEQLTTAREELSKAFQWSSLPDAETLSAVVKRLRPYADRWWRFLSKNFRAAKRDLLEFSRSGIGSTPKKWISNLEKLEDHLAAETKFRERAGIKATLGELFQGLDTDWERAGTLLQWAATVAHRGLDHASATQLLAKRTTDALRSTQVVEGRQQLTAELSQPDVAASLGLGSSVEMESWNDIRKRAETLLADIERFESTTASIALTDEMTLDEVD
ncbi:MAG TPA: DUF4011 domain-containing protein, partial [Lacipirellulaceae bacterium]|nr:DUF4011 domain-containing protein [Lacipirellulaceae bacterium]